MADEKTHECTFPEILSPVGQKLLGACLTCGLTAAEALMKLRGDLLRKVVADFINERPDFIRALENCPDDNQADYYRWNGNAEARRTLHERLREFGVDTAAAPALQDLTPTPAGRNAGAVRALHVLEATDFGDGTRYSACKADGYISGDLAADPCPTLKALNATDPVVEPIVDQETLTHVMYAALNHCLCNGGVPGWTILEEAQKAAGFVRDAGLKLVDLESAAAHKLVQAAIVSPSLTTPRDGGEAVPGHQARAVLEALRKAAQ